MKTSTPSTIHARSSRSTADRLAPTAKPNLLRRTWAGFIALLLMALAMLAATPVQAALIVKLPTATTAGSIENTEDITFTMTGSYASADVHLVLDEWVPSDGTQNNISIPASFPISINGGSDIGRASSLLRDNATGILADLTANDGFLGLGELTLVSGDTLTVRAGTIICPAQVITGFNPQANQTFTGSVFLMANLGTRISNIVTLPPAPPFATTGGWVNGGNFTVGTVGTTNDTNNWPANESPTKAVDGDANTKFLSFKGSNAGLFAVKHHSNRAKRRSVANTCRRKQDQE